jgi:soluble lytic murein transglycosylase
MTTVIRFAVALLALLATAIPARAGDADFLAARAAFERNDEKALAALQPALAGHVLAPYVEYWRLKLGLDVAEQREVRDFLARNAGTPLADQLRSDWLKLLGLKGQWALFAQDYVQGPNDDTELACYAIQARREREGDAALAAAKPFWFTGKATPESCAPLFAMLFFKGELKDADRWARMRLASEAGSTRLVQTLALDGGIPEKELRRVDNNPLAALQAGGFSSRQAAGRELALIALERSARRDPGATRAAWVKVRAQLAEPDRRYGDGRLAFHGARQLVPEANLWFREAGGAVLNEEQHAWRVRAALRVASWDDVRIAVDEMPSSQAAEPAWRYWKARALVAQGRADEAKPIFEALAPAFHFYGVLAAEALGRPLEPKGQPFVASDEALAKFGARPEVRRVVKLAELDMRMESLREWQPVVRPLDDDGLLLAAEYARRAGLNDRSINTADRTTTRHDFSLRYPTPFRPQFEAAAKAHDVDAALLYAIARQESRFVPDIVSSAGAQGLMQLMPATARWVARQLNQNGYRPAQIAELETNTSFGAYYFRYWLERLDNHPALAAAAYNAGPGRAQAWRPPASLDGAAWVETIPFNETRDYVKKVLANAMLYTRLLGRPEVPLATRLGTVGPRGPASTAQAPVPAAAPVAAAN